MKIYFAFTVFGDRSHLKHGKEILKLLEEKGHTVLTKHLFEENAKELDSRITPEEVFRRDVAWLKESDVMIADVTGSSFGIGFETGFVLGTMDKKVYLVYDATKKDSVSRMASGLVHENCIKFAYNNFEELKDFVEKNF